jgi:Zn-dependent protease
MFRILLNNTINVKRNPIMDGITSKIFLYIVIVLSAVIHEYSHGFVANELGDPTAKRLGRLTLNPLAHIDPIGTVLVPLVLMLTSGSFIGWAKPVPFNPQNIRDPKGELKIALAGPVSNLCLAIIVSLAFLGIRLIFPALLGIEPLIYAVSLIIYVNIFLALFNLIPVPPLDGSKILGSFLPYKARQTLFSIGPFGLVIALLASMMILPTIAGIVFSIFTGFGYIFG